MRNRYGIRLVGADSPYFCAKRAWDHAAETFRTRDTEDAYERVSNEIINDKISVLTAEQNAAVSRMFGLWQARHDVRKSLPFELTFKEWRAAIAHPLHFASIGWRPNWVDNLNDARAELAARREGRRKASWRKSSMKQNEKERRARSAPLIKAGSPIQPLRRG